MKQNYIPGIDGLRALAVVSVILFHLNSLLLPGGYIGVDIFFVISGYVISKSLFSNEYTKLTKYLIEFYRRRFIRILPALFFCLIITSMLSSLFIPEAWLSSLNKKTAIGAFWGVSNIIQVVFNDGYFAPRGEFNPFLHTWSLGVEEQFYLIYPLVFFLWFKYRKDDCLIGVLSKSILLVLLAMSLFYSCLLTNSNIDKAFYLLPSRFWELACGAYLFSLHSNGLCLPRSSRINTLLSVVGFSIVAFGFVFSKKSSFPFPWALSPVIGTVLLIIPLVADPKPTGWVTRLFNFRSTVYIGKISYSLYLWHWPVFTLFRWTIGIDGIDKGLLALFITYTMATFSYCYVETPIRTVDFWVTRGSLRPLLIGALLIFFSSSVPYVLYKNNITLSVTRDKYTWYPLKDTDQNENFNNDTKYSDKTMFVIGDSHAISYRTMLFKLSEQMGFDLKIMFSGGCHVLNLIEPMSDEDSCAEKRGNNLKMIFKEAKPGDIIFLASLRMIRLGSQWEIFNDAIIADKKLEASMITNRQAVEEQADDLIAKFASKDVLIIIDAPKPIFKAPPYRCSDWFNKRNPICEPGFDINREFMLGHRQFVMNSLNIIQEKHGNLSVWDPFFILCDNHTCSAFSEGRPKFFDGDHLSGYGNRLLIPSFREHITALWSTYTVHDQSLAQFDD